MHLNSKPNTNPNPTFDLLTLGSVHAYGLDYISTKFGVDSSSRFPSTARTHTHTYQTQLKAVPTTHATAFVFMLDVDI